MRTILFMLIFLFTITALSQKKVELIANIINYRNNVFKSDTLDICKINEQIGDENYFCKAFYKNGHILYIDGSGCDELLGFSFEYLFKNDTLLYSYNKIYSLTPQWTEGEEKEEEDNVMEFGEKEGLFYYYQNQPIEFEFETDVENDNVEVDNDEFEPYEKEIKLTLNSSKCQSKAYFLSRASKNSNSMYF